MLRDDVEQDPVKIRFYLAKILASPLFGASPTSSRLLDYIVSEALAGRSERLKGYSIGIDVFDQNADFDPNTNSIVRVQMGRLRNLLQQYYASEAGRGDQIEIALSKGTYIPQYLAAPREERATIIGRIKAAIRLNRSRLIPESIAIFVLAAAIVAIAVLYRNFYPVEERHKPKLFVSQFSAIDASAETGLITRGLQHDLIALLSQYPNLAVLGYETVAGDVSGARIPDLHDADYILEGSVATGNGYIKVSSELTSVRTGIVVWSNRTRFPYASAGDVVQSQSDIALRVASVLGQPDGVIQQASKALVAESKGVSFANYACILSAYDYKRQKDPIQHKKIRACLEKVTSENANYSSAWSMLSWVYGDEHRYGFNRRPKTSPSKRSLEAAEKAVKANPLSATAYQYMSIAQFYLGHDVEAERSIKSALRLSPNNSEVLADAGWQQALDGDGDGARHYFDEAIKINPDPPTWFWGGLAIDAIRHEDAQRAARFARLYTGDGVLSAYALAAAKRLNGDVAGAERLLSRLRLQYPGYEKPGNDFARRNRVDAKFSRWIFGTG